MELNKNLIFIQFVFLVVTCVNSELTHLFHVSQLVVETVAHVQFFQHARAQADLLAINVN